MLTRQAFRLNTTRQSLRFGNKLRVQYYSKKTFNQFVEKLKISETDSECKLSQNKELDTVKRFIVDKNIKLSLVEQIELDNIEGIFKKTKRDIKIYGFASWATFIPAVTCFSHSLYDVNTFELGCSVVLAFGWLIATFGLDTATELQNTTHSRLVSMASSLDKTK